MHRMLLGAVAVLALSVSSAYADPVVYSGGEKGDYYRSFGPAAAAVAGEATWLPYTVATTDGTGANLNLVKQNPEAVALLQGNVWADVADQYPEVKIARAGVANEAVLTVMSKALFDRSKGSWDAIVAKAGSARIRFVTGPESSGPGLTWKQFQKLDPRLASVDITYAASMDAALNAVASGSADIALMVQFPNPENPRFEYVATNNLKVGGVLFREMRNLQVPGTDGVAAFEYCQGVTVSFTGGFLGIGATENKVDTACTPLLHGVNVAAGDDLVNGLADAQSGSLLPPADSGLGAVLSQIKVLAGSAASSALDAANRAAEAISENM